MSGAAPVMDRRVVYGTGQHLRRARTTDEAQELGLSVFVKSSTGFYRQVEVVLSGERCVRRPALHVGLISDNYFFQSPRITFFSSARRKPCQFEDLAILYGDGHRWAGEADEAETNGRKDTGSRGCGRWDDGANPEEMGLWRAAVADEETATLEDTGRSVRRGLG
jgi:hypothetical protein